MSAYDDAFHVLEDNRWRRVARDVRLAVWLAKFVIAYLTVGRRIRRLYLEKKRANEPFWLD